MPSEQWAMLRSVLAEWREPGVAELECSAIPEFGL